MKLQATESGTWPPGLTWSVGKVRDIELPTDAEPPAWLVPVKATKAKAKGKAKATDTAIDEG